MFRRASRSSSQTSPEPGQLRVGMSIPGARMDNVPPPLPPPRYINGLDHGIDLAWDWQNKEASTGINTLAPIKPNSSLLGHHFRSQLVRDEDEDVLMDLEIDHLPSPSRSSRSPSHSHLATSVSHLRFEQEESSSTSINRRLQGDRPMVQQNHNLSTHAYDKHLLQKIGKTTTPPNLATSPSVDHSRPAQKLSIQTKATGLRLQSAKESFSSSSSSDSLAKWMVSPHRTVSAKSRTAWRQGSMDLKIPGDSQASSSTLDPDLFLAQFTVPTISENEHASIQSHAGTQSRSERGSLDSTANTEDQESVQKEPSLNVIRLGEKPRPSHHHGFKRRALSPAPDIEYGQRIELKLSNASEAQNMLLRKPYEVASLSSTISSNLPSPFTSSHQMSNASSMTSFSSLDTTSTHVFGQKSAYTSLPCSADTGNMPIQPLSQKPDASLSSRTSQPSTASEARTIPSLSGNHYICGCCPKKPRKYETKEQLRVHENEKQYTCAYCSNRFKNKNEAERHQNSLHLRKQSWACAAISTYQAAFYPGTVSNSSNLTTDICGFCGDEFTNTPPNWADRIDHLTNAHKFGECNSTKKFFRADHFRQHLKHSHAGKSGKWTNILENTCQREEVLSEPTSLSPTASEHSQSGNASRLQVSISNRSEASLSGVKLTDDRHEEP